MVSTFLMRKKLAWDRVGGNTALSFGLETHLQSLLSLHKIHVLRPPSDPCMWACIAVEGQREEFCLYVMDLGYGSNMMDIAWRSYNMHSKRKRKTKTKQNIIFKTQILKFIYISTSQFYNSAFFFFSLPYGIIEVCNNLATLPANFEIFN